MFGPRASALRAGAPRRTGLAGSVSLVYVRVDDVRAGSGSIGAATLVLPKHRKRIVRCWEGYREPSRYVPAGLGSEALEQRRLGTTVSVDWIDAFLLFCGMLTQVVLILLVADRVPAVAANLSNEVLWARGAVVGFASLFAFGLLLIRRRLFPQDPEQPVVLREGGRLMSIAGLMLIALGMGCLGMLSGVLLAPA